MRLVFKETMRMFTMWRSKAYLLLLPEDIDQARRRRCLMFLCLGD